MRKILIATLLFLSAFAANADLPFRQHRFDHLCSLKADSNAILFIGNSITDMYNWNEALKVQPPYYICNRGVSGALSDEILEHIPQLVACKPYKVFLMIGTNDLGSGRTPQQVADNVAKIVSEIKRLSPRTKIYFQSILPSTVGSRTLEAEDQANQLIRQLAYAEQLTYIDLWPSLFEIPTNKNLSLDGLHLTGSGYWHWINGLAYNHESAPIPEAEIALTANHDAQPTQLWGSNAMRASYFRMNKIGAQNILFFGDEMVKCGEWNELLHDPYFLNRGTGWGYDGTAPSIATTSALVTASQPGAPKAILLYTGTGDLNTQQPIDSVRQHYLQLVAQILRKYPCTPLYLVSLMPTTHNTDRIEIFNSLTRQLCEAQHNLHYIDIYTPLSQGHTTNPRYFQGNYLNGLGYELVAKVIEEHLYPNRNADYRILRSLQESRTQGWDKHWIAVSNTLVLSPLPTIGYTIADLASPDHRYRPQAVESALSLGLTAATTMGLKAAVARPRPWVEHRNNLQCIQHVSSYSFPSGHTSFCFSTATSLSLICPKWYVAVPAYLWASSVAFSRMYIGAHYPSDVLAGALIGTGCAIAAHFLTPLIVKESPLPADAAMLPAVSLTF
ncbi:MAG: GDSL-type esterase/lipase family protein [Bacteroidales bacterium]|nr:GDSL-type esterase/lipase family protein [Bacteroidales bacterium]